MALTQILLVLTIVVWFAAGVMWRMATRRMAPRKRLPTVHGRYLTVDTSKVKREVFASTGMGVTL